mmetsp:Transcript_49087/g.60320  ORF Transcript_49087/g.60320 Transcript_49087/m.60320 type:complete len:301 (-) Transcript_49087:1265-2167(-)
MQTPGRRFRDALKKGKPLQCLGTVNAYTALLAKNAGANAIYLSGSGVATASLGLPDLGITNLNDLLIDITRITNCVPDIPLLVDVDTGFGSALNIRRTVNELIKCGAAGLHIEDQISEKRCGHRPNKSIVSVDEMIDRIKTCVITRNNSNIDKDFVIMARTDAFANEGMDGLLHRCDEYINKGGADMLFLEALTDLNEYNIVNKYFNGEIPLLANITEFGKTPLYNINELGNVGVSIVLYPLSAHRAMAKAASNVYKTIINDGHQKNCIDIMQTRNELYHELGYWEYESLLDGLFGKQKE